MKRLLTIAELVSGAAARHRVFEPLLADWQRQLLNADGTVARAAIGVSGALAFIRALAVCAMIDGAWIPPLRATATSLAAITIAVGISVGVLLLAPTPQNVPRDVSEPLLQGWILGWASVLVPPAFILGAFLLRRDARVTRRHAVLFAVLAAAATTAVVVNTTDEALRKRFDTFENQEHMRELALARHRAGGFLFTGDRYLRESTSTVADRRANYQKFRALMAAHRQEPAPTWRDRLAQATPVMLAVIFAVMGWTLAGLRRVTVWRAFMWWVLVFAQTITMTRIFWLVVQVPSPRVPQWLMLPMFGAMMVVLLLAARRRGHPVEVRP